MQLDSSVLEAGDGSNDDSQAAAVMKDGRAIGQEMSYAWNEVSCAGTWCLFESRHLLVLRFNIQCLQVNEVGVHAREVSVWGNIQYQANST